MGDQNRFRSELQKNLQPPHPDLFLLLKKKGKIVVMVNKNVDANYTLVMGGERRHNLHTLIYPEEYTTNK